MNGPMKIGVGGGRVGVVSFHTWGAARPMMQFGWSGSRGDDQERILETPLVQEGVL